MFTLWLFCCCQSHNLLSIVLSVVEMQGLRDNQPREMLVMMEPLQAADAGKSRRRRRRRRKGTKASEDVVSSDISGENLGRQLSLSGEIQRQTSRSTQDVQPLTADSGESYQTEELFEVKRYPAYHYDMYGTMYSLTDGVRPSTLEKNTVKSASAECLDIHSFDAQPSVRRASDDEVDRYVLQSSAVAAEQRKPKPPPKPLKPLPRPKPRTDRSKDTATQPAMKSASTDPALVEELSSLLKQSKQTSEFVKTHYHHVV